MSIKKSFLIICLALYLPIASWGQCFLSKPEKSGTSNEDIYLTQNDHDKAYGYSGGIGLICRADVSNYKTKHGCRDTERVVIYGEHYRRDKQYGSKGDRTGFYVWQCNRSYWDLVGAINVGYCHQSGTPARTAHFESESSRDGWKFISFNNGRRLIGKLGQDIDPNADTIYYSEVCALDPEVKCKTSCAYDGLETECDGGKWVCRSGNWYEQLTGHERYCKEKLGVTDKNDIQACAKCVESEGAWDQAGKTCNCEVEWRKFNAKDLRCENDNNYCGGILCTTVGDVFACVGDKAIPIKGYDSPQDRLLRCSRTDISPLWWKSQKVEQLSIDVCVVNDADGKTPAVNNDAKHTWKKIMDGLFVDTYYEKPDPATGVYKVQGNNWCKTCPDGQFYNGSKCLYSHQEKEAWCLLRKKQDEEKDNKYEISWTDDGCKCGADGYKWNDTEHKCDDNRETFCGLICYNADDQNNKTVKVDTTVICNADVEVEVEGKNQTKKKVVVKKCNSDFKWENVSDFVSSIGLCQVENPEKREPLGGGYTKFAKDDVVFMKDGTKPIADTAPNAYKFDDTSTGNFCRVCEDGKYYYDDAKGGQCLDNSDEAWCKFEKQKWTGTDCNCTEQGKYWNKEKHSCEEKGTFCGLLCGNAYNEKIILCRDDDLELRQCIASEGNWKPYTPEGAKNNDWKTVLDQQCSGDEWYAFSKSGMLFKYKNKEVHPFDEDWAKNAYVITDDNFLKTNWCLPCPKGKFYVESDGVGECIDNEQQAKCINYTGAQWREDPADSGNYRCICDDPKSHWTGKECRANGETCAERCEKETISKEQCVACCKIGGGVDWDMSQRTCDCKDARKAWNAKTNVCDWTNDEIIKRAVDGVSPFFNNVEKNKTVWRTEEGKFNTTRLASDAIAGTVLGTVGGIVSANVIKKNQLAKGCDVLHCAIGGQNVADWGDTFNVLGPKD